MKQTTNNAGARTPEPVVTVEPIILQKRIGSTTFVVNVHFSQSSKESMTDKLMRLIEREVA